MIAPVDFTKDTLPAAVAELFKMNNYDVSEDVHIHGAQIDIVAKSKSNQFSPVIYIEVTIEYVDNTKYGKDSTKFILLRRVDPECICLCVSSRGFTPDVKERATQAGVRVQTYLELFNSFQRFGPYVDAIVGDVAIQNFDKLYEEPNFTDEKGDNPATQWLRDWRNPQVGAPNWLIVLGEYGTGKTSLTKILQYRWISEYKIDPSLPIVFRIELKNFTRQFDARTLLHHFLDINHLGHLPIDFVFYLIRIGRVILLLDGYDEMAQFLNPRERRACLSALADLANEGARGLLTSRPNYFSETEELRVFEALYASLAEHRYSLGRAERSMVDAEKHIDTLVERYLLDRYERHIRDLSPAQTQALVCRQLANDPEGQELVLALLAKVFRAEPSGTRLALSGKPVIISYLLELLEELRNRREVESADGNEPLTEWQIYRMIVDRLMLRDFQRSPLPPQSRRTFLQLLAVALSGRDGAIATAQTFYPIIEQVFRSDLRFMDPEERTRRREELFEDLRTSATLTRSEGHSGSGWAFSHNSLREYLAAEYLIYSVRSKNPAIVSIPITSAMRSFAAALPGEEMSAVVGGLWETWHLRASRRDMGGYITLFWDSLSRQSRESRFIQPLFGVLERSTLPIDGIRVNGVDFETIKWPSGQVSINGADSEFSEVSFRDLDLRGSNFEGTFFDNVLFRGTRLDEINFSGCLLYDCDFTDAIVSGTDFRRLDPESIIVIYRRYEPVTRLSGAAATGYLAFHGATTDRVEPYHFWTNHPKFSIAFKIGERVIGQRNSQLRGLTQRGEAHDDPPFARGFVDHLKQHALVTVNRNYLVSATILGRQILSDFVEYEKMDQILVKFFEEWR